MISTISNVRAVSTVVIAALIALFVAPAATSASPLSADQLKVVEEVGAASQLDPSEVEAVLGGVPESLLVPQSGAAFTGGAVGFELRDGSTVIALQLDDSGIDLSAIAVVLDGAGAVVVVNEVFFTETGSDLQFKQWSTAGGVQIGKNADGGIKQYPGVSAAKAFKFSLKTFNDCLASAGVAWWVVAMVAGVCGVVGVPTAGIGFIACAVGTLGISSSVAGFCYAKATS